MKNTKKWAGIIYLLTNLITGLQYVGYDTSCDPENHRWRTHIDLALKGKSKCYVHRAIRKYGIENFSAEVIQWCRTIETLKKAEIRWIKKLRTLAPSGYNMTGGGDGVYGYRASKSSKTRRSVWMAAYWSIAENKAAHAARLNTPEYLAKQSAAQKRRFAKMTKAERAAFSKKMSKVEKKRYAKAGALEVMRAAQARRFADEVKKATNAAAHNTPEFIAKQAKISKAKWKDKKWAKKRLVAYQSADHKANQSAAGKKWHSDEAKHANWLAVTSAPEVREKISTSLTNYYAKPINKKKHLASHRTEEFRAKKSADTKAFWAAMTPEARSAYWHKIRKK
jgi:group I intron endonuclease